jgi:hypothetical protein
MYLILEWAAMIQSPERVYGIMIGYFVVGNPNQYYGLSF